MIDACANILVFQSYVTLLISSNIRTDDVHFVNN